MSDYKISRCYMQYCRWLDHLQSPFLLFIRFYWGWQFFIAGKGKLLHLDRVTGFFTDLGIPFSAASAVLVGVVEGLGGLLLILGLFSRLISIPLVIVMATAYATAHREALYIVVLSIQGWSFSLDEFVKQEPYTFLMVVLLVLIFGPGKFSVDHLLKNKLLRDI